MAEITDLFCGAGGSSLGAEMAGGSLRLALNHWERAIETHATNFEHADHDCNDVSALTTAQIRNYPDSDILLASPECTNHSIAKGGQRRKPRASSEWEDGPGGDAEQERSRSTMWDVCRFAEQKILKGKPYKAIIVENVVDAYKWGYEDDGGLFKAWIQAMVAMGYYYQIVWLNSMFCPPTPQSRDRMYVVFWRKGMRPPNLQFSPPSWCAQCELVVDGFQTWKKPDKQWGRYGTQYYFTCQTCTGTVIPGVYPAASVIDWDLPAGRIGDREKPLAAATRNRIQRGLERLANEPFAIRLTHGGAPKPLTLPVVTLTQRHDMAMVMPVGGNLYERTPGNRVRDPEKRPFDTVHTSFAQAVVMRNNSGGAEMCTSTQEQFRTITTRGHQSLVMSYHRTGTTKDVETEPTFTVTTRDRLAMVIPFTRNGRARDVDRDVVQTLATEGPPGLALTEDDIDDCRFRMFALHEIADVMAMRQQADGSEYQVLGNKRERMAQYGNAVTPPVMKALVERILEVI